MWSGFTGVPKSPKKVRKKCEKVRKSPKSDTVVPRSCVKPVPPSIRYMDFSVMPRSCVKFGPPRGAGGLEWAEMGISGAPISPTVPICGVSSTGKGRNGHFGLPHTTRARFARGDGGRKKAEMGISGCPRRCAEASAQSARASALSFFFCNY